MRGTSRCGRSVLPRVASGQHPEVRRRLVREELGRRTRRRARRAASAAARSCRPSRRRRQLGSQTGELAEPVLADELLDPRVVRRGLGGEAVRAVGACGRGRGRRLRSARPGGPRSRAASAAPARTCSSFDERAARRDDHGGRAHEPERDHRAPVERHRRGSGGRRAEGDAERRQAVAPAARRRTSSASSRLARALVARVRVASTAPRRPRGAASARPRSARRRATPCGVRTITASALRSGEAPAELLHALAASAPSGSSKTCPPCGAIAREDDHPRRADRARRPARRTRSPSMSSADLRVRRADVLAAAPVDVRAAPLGPSAQSTSMYASRTSIERRVDHVRDADRVVHRRAVELGVPRACGSARRSPSARRPPSRRGRRRAAARCASSVISAWCVTSRPTIVMSMPLAKTRCAASGSAQMLNSAAGVRLPSPIAPPIRTIRSGRASGCSASRSAMFVSGPVGTSVSLPVARADLAREEVDRVLGRSARRRRRQVGPVEARLAVHVRGDVALAHERPVGARGRPACRRGRRARARAARSRSSCRASGCPRRS